MRACCNNASPGLSRWIVARNLWCKRGGTFKTLGKAQAACLTLGSQCHGVYDARCDGRGESHVCKMSSVSAPNSGGCVYKPASVSSTAFKPRTSTELKSAVRTYLQSSATYSVLWFGSPKKTEFYQLLYMFAFCFGFVTNPFS